ncbi:helix-turn-helix domain-containing protein [Bacillus sp. N9]
MLESRSLNTFSQLMRVQPKQLHLFMKKVNLSERQLHYDLEKINYLLNSKSLPPIRISNELIHIPSEVVGFYKKNGTDFIGKHISFDQEDRIIIILLYTFIRRESISNYHFQRILGISKNTVSADVKRVNQFCIDFRVRIHYTREQGYHLKGLEEDKRNLMLKAISMLTIKPHAEETFKFIFHQQQLKDQFDHYQQVLKEFEQQYSLVYIEERMGEFIYLLQMVYIRQQQQKWVSIFADTAHF